MLYSFTLPSAVGLLVYMRTFLRENMNSPDGHLAQSTQTAQDEPETEPHGELDDRIEEDRPLFPPPLCICIAAKISNEVETLPETLRQFVPKEDGGEGILVPPGTLILVVFNPSFPLDICVS